MSKYTFGKGRKISKTIVLGFNSSEKLSNNNEFDSIQTLAFEISELQLIIKGVRTYEFAY